MKRLAVLAGIAGILALAAIPVAGANPSARSGVAVKTVSVANPHRLPVGAVLHAHATSPFATFQWYRCNSRGRGCRQIAGATSSAYRVRRVDFGHTLRVRIVQANATAVSAPTQPVGRGKPVNQAIPELSDNGAGGGAVGDPTASGANVTVGDVLTGTNGTWNANAIRFTYQWEDCTTASPPVCTSITGATSQSYTVASSDVGNTIVFVVTAYNF